jgi:hypothetical protein
MASQAPLRALLVLGMPRRGQSSLQGGGGHGLVGAEAGEEVGRLTCPDRGCQWAPFVDQLLEQCRQPWPEPEWVPAELKTEDAGLLRMDQDLVGREVHQSVGSQPVLQNQAAGDTVGDVLGLVGLQAESGEDPVGIAHDRPVDSSGRGGDRDVLGDQVTGGGPEQKRAGLVLAALVGDQPSVDEGLCDLVESAAATANVGEQYVCRLQLPAEVLALESVEPGPFEAVVSKGHEMPACVSGKDSLVLQVRRFVETHLDVPLELGKLLFARLQHFGKHQQPS